MKALLMTYRQSPRKARLLADLIRGKKVLDAKYALMFADKKSAPVFIKLLDSALANAKQNFSIDADNLFVKVATVNAGVTMKRSMPRARGSAFPINKRTSHIAIELAQKEEKPKAGEKVEKLKPVKAKVVKKVKSKKAE
jgi:large subunit ribosomal protein L22